MMSTRSQVFVYEFVTGGGWWSMDAEQPPRGSLLSEGSLMRAAVLEDFARLGHKVVTTIDRRVPAPSSTATSFGVTGIAEEREIILQLAAESDATLVIAPEFDRHLYRRCQWVVQAGGRLLSPDPRFVARTSDKFGLNRWLARHRVPVPRCRLRAGSWPADFPYPAICKPRWGAGSMGVQLLRSPEDIPRELSEESGGGVLEQYCPGMAASVAVMGGPREQLILPACRQRLSDDGRFTYLGGEWPLPSELDCRARRLVGRLIEVLPGTTGYFGVDLVLGDSADGSQDFVIEVNPRLTTSYIGLRRACCGNLAEGMLLIAEGSRCELSFGAEAVEFSAVDA